MIPLFCKFCQSYSVGGKGCISNWIFFLSKVERLFLGMLTLCILLQVACSWCMPIFLSGGVFSSLFRGGLYNVMNIKPLFIVCCKYFLLAWHLVPDFVCIVFCCMEWMRDTEHGLIFPCWFRALVTDFQGWIQFSNVFRAFQPTATPWWCCFVGGCFSLFLFALRRICCCQVHLLVADTCFFPCASFCPVSSWSQIAGSHPSWPKQRHTPRAGILH